MDDTTRLTSLVFRIPRERLELIKGLARKTRVRQSEYLREAVADLLAKYEAAMPLVGP